MKRIIRKYGPPIFHCINDVHVAHGDVQND